MALNKGTRSSYHSTFLHIDQSMVNSLYKEEDMPLWGGAIERATQLRTISSIPTLLVHLMKRLPQSWREIQTAVYIHIVCVRVSVINFYVLYIYIYICNIQNNKLFLYAIYTKVSKHIPFKIIVKLMDLYPLYYQHIRSHLCGHMTSSNISPTIFLQTVYVLYFTNHFLLWYQ